jgi:anti-anti-sigma regulatory factor
VHLDLSDLGFAGAFFVGRLLELAASLEKRGVPLTLSAPTRALGRLFARLGLEDRFDVPPAPRVPDRPSVYASAR